MAIPAGSRAGRDLFGRSLWLRGHLTYWIAGLTIIATGGALYLAAARMQEAVFLLEGNFAKTERLAHAAAEVSRAEAAQRGFLLYGAGRFLQERDAALERLRREIAGLGVLMEGDIAQRERLARLAESVEARAAWMAAEGTHDAGVAQAQSQLIHSALAEVWTEERARLGSFRAAEKAAYERTLLVVVAAMGVVLIVLVPAYAAFVGEARGRRRAEGFVSSIVDAVPGALVRYRLLPDGTSRYEFVSEGALRLRGFTREEAVRDPQTVLRTIHEEDRPGFLAALAEAARTGALVQHDYRVWGPGQEQRWIRTTASPRRERDGSTVFSAYWSDVTAQKELEAALREAKEAADAANRAKSMFLATMSHEIRTPMNGVLGMLELLSLTELNPEQRGTLTVIRESGRSLMSIIDDILDLAKIEAGKLELRPEPSDVTDLAQRACNVYAGNASSKGLLLRHLSDGRVGRALVVDPLRLLQILNNLVSNAIKFTERGEVTLWTRLVEARDGVEVVSFSVIDTGQGISDEDRQRLFAPFSQVPSSPQASAGTGLGLSICRRLAALMGSSIEVESSPGRGTTMSLTLTLPVASQGPRAERGESAGPAHDDPTRGRRRAPSVEDAVEEGSLVMVVDDHPINRMVLLRQVQALGYAAQTAADGIEALDLWASGRFALIFTDCHMPELDGYSLTRHIRGVERRYGHARTPIIACTANVLGGEAERCLECGMDDYLPKPVVLRHLALKLDRWLPLQGRPAAGSDRAEGPDAPRAPPQAVLDRKRLAMVVGDDAAVQHEALGKFRAFNKEDVAGLLRAVESGNPDEAAHYAHRIKGAARTFGADCLGGLAEELEHIARRGQVEAVRRRLQELEAALRELDQAIDVAIGEVGLGVCAPRPPLPSPLGSAKPN